MRLYHALGRLESTVVSMASLAGAVLQIPKQALALKYKAKLSFMDSRPHGDLKRLESLQASRTDYLPSSNPAVFASAINVRISATKCFSRSR